MFAIAIGALGLGFLIFNQQGVQDLTKVLSGMSRGHFSLHGTIYLIVVFSLIWYGLLWMVNGHHEIGQLATWISTAYYKPESPILVNATLLGIGIFFGLLFVYSTNFPVFMGLFTLYVICDIYLWRRRRVEMAKIISSMLEAIQKDQQSTIVAETYYKKAQIASIYKEAAHIFQKYYVKRNHYMRVGGELCVALPLFVISYYHIRLPFRISDTQFREGGYLLLWLAVFIAELFVYRWRLEMNKGIAKLAAELCEVERKWGTEPEAV